MKTQKKILPMIFTFPSTTDFRFILTKTKTILTLLLCVVAQVVMAQSKVISGTVEDALGPVMMANVTERDGNNRIVNATQTDMMGNFSMEIKNPKNKLVIFSYGDWFVLFVVGDKTDITLAFST